MPTDDPMPEFTGGHRIITWAAMHCLPRWQGEFWSPELYDLANVYSLYGDTYWTNKEEIGPFIELPDGFVYTGEVGQLRFKHHYDLAVDYWESPFYDRCQQLLTYYAARMAESLADGNVRDAARFAGSAAHYLEDSGVPAHAAAHGDLEFVRDYLPPPPALGCLPLHGYTERSPERFLIDDYRPRLYGTTTEELGANFVHRYAEMIVFARGLLFPLARCAYEGNDEEAGRLRLKAARMCAYVFADYMYSVTCIGMGRFEQAGTTALSTIELTSRWPYRMTAWAPAPYFAPGPMRLRGINLDMDRQPVPCELLVRGDDGAHAEQFEEALGAGAYFEYHYRVLEGLYRRFTGRVGIHAVLGAKRPIDIKVLADDTPVFEAVAKPGEPAHEIEVAVNGCRDLKLIASGPILTDPDGSDNHVVWALPRLSK